MLTQDAIRYKSLVRENKLDELTPNEDIKGILKWLEPYLPKETADTADRLPELVPKKEFFNRYGYSKPKLIALIYKTYKTHKRELK